jgi:hypothetical protein
MCKDKIFFNIVFYKCFSYPGTSEFQLRQKNNLTESEFRRPEYCRNQSSDIPKKNPRLRGDFS